MQSLEINQKYKMTKEFSPIQESTIEGFLKENQGLNLNNFVKTQSNSEIEQNATFPEERFNQKEVEENNSLQSEPIDSEKAIRELAELFDSDDESSNKDSISPKKGDEKETVDNSTTLVENTRLLMNTEDREQEVSNHDEMQNQKKRGRKKTIFK